MIVHLPDNLLLVLSANKKENLTGSLFLFYSFTGLQGFPGSIIVYALCTPYKISSIRTIVAAFDKYSDCFHCSDACLNQFVSIAYILNFQTRKEYAETGFI